MMNDTSESNSYLTWVFKDLPKKKIQILQHPCLLDDDRTLRVTFCIVKNVEFVIKNDVITIDLFTY